VASSGVVIVTADTVISDVDGNPYVGVRPFRPEEASQFFGRSRETGEVGRRWRTSPLTVLHGPSGVGKTSLLMAGLLADLAGPSFDILPVGRVTTARTFPAAALPEHNP
jgi:hypothetical protein